MLFSGRIHPKKGCDHLLEAFSKLASRRPQLHLVMAGPEDRQFASQIKEKQKTGASRLRESHNMDRYDFWRHKMGSSARSR